LTVPFTVSVAITSTRQIEASWVNGWVATLMTIFASSMLSNVI